MADIGRPLIEINWLLVDELCARQCTLEEIAEALDVSADTIERAMKREKGVTFAEYFGQKRMKGFRSLRTKQFEIAIRGNVTMLIWLGKQYLGQRDKFEESSRNMDRIDALVSALMVSGRLYESKEPLAGLTEVSNPPESPESHAS